MDWSTQQTSRIIEQFWQGSTVRCPNDSGPLRFRLQRMLGGDYGLSAECPVCGRTKELRRGDDPRRTVFRPWTAAEMEVLRQVAMPSGKASCPVCEATVETQCAPASSIPALIRCFRCGNSNQWRQAAASVETSQREQPS